MKKLMLLLFSLAISLFAFAQSSANKPTYGVLQIDVTSGKAASSFSSAQLGNLLRMHLERLDTFQVIDRYDQSWMLDSAKIDPNNCFGRICLTNAGKLLKADFMISGSVDFSGEWIILTLRRVNVKKGEIDKTVVREFLFLPSEVNGILLIALNDLLGIRNPEVLTERLTRKDGFANSINTPYVGRIAADGPRLGVSMLTGQNALIVQRPEDQGGYNAYPFTFHFGYQFEKQYLNEGNFQALFEFIPLISGLEQGRFIPSFSILNGLRSNRSGWEFAFGPSVSFTQLAEVGLDSAGRLLTKKQFEENNITAPINGYRRQIDSRGLHQLDAFFILAAGKTIKSGQLNIPVNIFIVPKRNDFRVGISMGYNAKTRN